MTSLSDTSVKPASRGPRHTTAILAVVLLSHFMLAAGFAAVLALMRLDPGQAT